MDSQTEHPAALKLRGAVLATEPSDDWFTKDLVIIDLVQESVSIWAGDLGCSMQRAAAAVEKARAHADQPNEEVGNQLEDALGQIGSARDKLIAVGARRLWRPITRRAEAWSQVQAKGERRQEQAF